MIAHQIEAVRAELASRPEGLRHHVERVLREALALASAWDLDPQRVELAVWGHDLYRASPPEEQLVLAEASGVPVDEDERAYPILLHGPIAAAVLSARFGVDDADVLAAVRDHTAGLGEMSQIAKVVLLADKIEPRKRARAPQLAAVRDIALRDLDTAILCWADWRWVDERKRDLTPQGAHWRARGEWVHQHHADAAMPRRVDDGEFEVGATG